MAIDKIQSESINLADNFAFTGTVSGAGGITGAEILYHTSQTTLSSSYTKLPDWSSHNGSQIGSIGSNLTNSSGDISFPSTGIWLIQSRITYYATGSTENRYCISQIRSSTDSGSNYTVIDESIDNLVNVNSGGNDFTITQNHYILDVTNTSTQRIAFYAAAEATTKIETYNKATIFTAVRLGDT